MAVQQLHDREKEEPEADYRGEDSQDEDGGTAVIQMATGERNRIEIWIGNAAISDARAEGGHEHECDADDDAEVEHGANSFATAAMRHPPTRVDAAMSIGAIAAAAGSVGVGWTWRRMAFFGRQDEVLKPDGEDGCA